MYLNFNIHMRDSNLNKSLEGGRGGIVLSDIMK